MRPRAQQVSGGEQQLLSRQLKMATGILPPKLMSSFEGLIRPTHISRQGDPRVSQRQLRNIANAAQTFERISEHGKNHIYLNQIALHDMKQHLVRNQRRL